MGAFAAGVAMLACAPAQADTPAWRTGVLGAALGGVTEHEHVDTEHIFGFTMGSDIGEKGEIEFENENVGVFGKRAGIYNTLGSLNLLKFTLTDNFRVAPGLSFGGNVIRNVPGYDNRSAAAFQGAVLEMRYKLLDRETMPFGLTLHAQPGWSPIDEATGAQAQGYGSEFALLADKELVKDRLWGAFNLWYGLGASNDVGANAWSRDSSLELHGALSTRVGAALVMGGEMRYLRAYDGLGLNRFSGEALYIGPTFSMHVTKHVGLSGTVNVQVAGDAVGDPRALDLDNFERVQSMLRFNMLF
ncbi:hypothetical protein M2323_000560 [Rhodoblastus acidophilus]|uniref:hypothetical protein n=1 Tax=Rhodoblastus acidophilus TaxID=1074 RepID=UPI00222423E2|nr:hypothetical protein [Rhodoblastus acidophilus]MCW2282795.1 hypothetical protein [Rhodoblastus acidophilus]MCW2331656.1 hypothetical protein [Rhodoblastus acidophilus]